MRSAWNVRRAGWGPPGVVPGRPRPRRRADRCVIGARDRARTMARGDPARPRLLAELEDQVGELLLGQPVHEVGCGRPLVAHPHVQRSVVAIAEPTFRPVELHRGDPEVEEHAVDRTVDGLLIDLGEAGTRRSAPDRRRPRAVPARARARSDRGRRRSRVPTPASSSAAACPPAPRVMSRTSALPPRNPTTSAP